MVNELACVTLLETCVTSATTTEDSPFSTSVA